MNNEYFKKSRDYPIRLYTTNEAAEIMRVSKHYIYKMTWKKMLIPIKQKCSKGKQKKYCKSFFTDAELIRAINKRLNVTPAQLAEISTSICRRRKVDF